MTQLAGRLAGANRQATARNEGHLTHPAVAQAGWFAGGNVVAFLLPYVFTSLLDLQHDLYYLVYFAGVAAVLTAYVRATSFDIAAFARQNWRLSLLIGAVSSAFVVWNVLARNDATPHPSGAYFAFEIAWRGLAYGVVDALLLTAFPAMVAFSLLHADVRGFVRRLSFGVLALALVVIITGAYHLGYEQYRDDGIGQPETGNTIISMPMLISLNPAGSIITHASMHIAAVAHAYETDVFLPPKVEAD